MKAQVPLSYLQSCKSELESTLQYLEGGKEKEYYFAQLFYIDENQSCEIPFNFIIPIPFAFITFYRDTLGKILSISPIDIPVTNLLDYCNDYLNWLNQLLNSDSIDSVSLDDINNKCNAKSMYSTHSELKKICSELAIKHGLIKWQTNPKAKIQLVYKELIQMGYNGNYGSVASTLRAKLDYSRSIK